MICPKSSTHPLRNEAPSLSIERSKGSRHTRFGTVLQPQRIYCLQPRDHRQVFPPLNAPHVQANRLPNCPNRFFGREAELETIERLFKEPDCRLVTLLGPGGVGKTRMAIEFSNRLAAEHEGSIWWVNLADIISAASVPDRILAAMQHTPRPGVSRMVQVLESIGDKPAFIVLDNFEQLELEAADHVHTIVTNSPGCSVLVTSRHALNLPGEHIFNLHPLAVPYESYSSADLVGTDDKAPQHMLSLLQASPAVQLFVDRVKAIRLDFQLAERNMKDVWSICSCLEGIPLALELAAGRAQVLVPSQIRRQLADRFEFLVTRKRNVQARHRTLHDAVRWSYDLLPHHLGRLFCQLAVFHGGWSIEAAVSVFSSDDPHIEPAFATMLEWHEELSEYSLLVCDVTGDAPRYRMLETIREFAQIQLERSGGLSDARERHFAWCLQFAETANRHIIHSEYEPWLTCMDLDNANVQAALNWSIASSYNSQNALALANALCLFWRIRGRYSEGRSLLKSVLQCPGAENRTAARHQALAAAGELASHQGDYDEAVVLCEESLSISRDLGDSLAIAWSLANLAHVALEQGSINSARQQFEQSLILFNKVGDVGAIEYVNAGLGRCSG